MAKQLSTKFLQEQKTIIKYIFRGLPTSKIAQKMHYSRSTISYRINLLFEKYSVTTRNELILAIVAQLSASNKDVIRMQQCSIELLNSKLERYALLLKNIIFDFKNGYPLQKRITEAKNLLKEN